MREILVAGGRDFDDYELLMTTLLNIIDDIIDTVEIVSGHAPGADSLAEKFAKQFNILCKTFPADWDKYGKLAGPIRNSQMIDYISHSYNPVVVAFWDGKSKGTLDTIKKAQQKNITPHVIYYNKGEEKDDNLCSS